MEDREVWFDKDWLTVENYQFKILTMIAVLAENHFAYRGKLKDMCEFLGVSSQSKNNAKIKEAIEALAAKGDIKVIKDGHTYTLTLSVKAEKTQRIIKIRKAWVDLIQGYKAIEKNRVVSWENILKVFVYLIADKAEIKTYKAIAADLNLSRDIVINCFHAFDTIEFNNLEVKRKLRFCKKNNDEFKCIGQEIDVKTVWE